MSLLFRHAGQNADLNPCLYVEWEPERVAAQRVQRRHIGLRLALDRTVKAHPAGQVACLWCRKSARFSVSMSLIHTASSTRWRLRAIACHRGTSALASEHPGDARVSHPWVRVASTLGGAGSV